MEDVLDDFNSKKSIDLSKYQFRGKLSGISWKREQALDRMSKVRKIIFVMSLLVFYPIIIQYAVNGDFHMALFIERLIYSIILLLCGLFFNRFRLATMIIASLPILLILATYLFFIEYLQLRTIAFFLAILFFLGMGIYSYFQVKKSERQLKEEIKRGNPEVVAIE